MTGLAYGTVNLILAVINVLMLAVLLFVAYGPHYFVL